MQNLYGWDDYFGEFNGLNPKLGRSINDVMPVLRISTLGQTLTRKAQGDPIDVIYSPLPRQTRSASIHRRAVWPAPSWPKHKLNPKVLG